MKHTAPIRLRRDVYCGLCRLPFLCIQGSRNGVFHVVNQPRHGVDNYHVRYFDSSSEQVGRATGIGRSEDALVSWENDFEVDLNNDLSIGRIFSGLTDLDVI